MTRDSISSPLVQVILKLYLWTVLWHLSSAGPAMNGFFNAQPWGVPQMRQRFNLENGICSQPMVIAVCIEGSMARNVGEFRHTLEFAGNVVSTLRRIQPRQFSMAINYCSYIKGWTPWTNSARDFATDLDTLQWPYHYAPTPWGPYGGYPAAGGLGYGRFSPLQPNSGLCIERARQSMAQVPPYFQRLILHLTSGHSSNPLLTMQHAQAAMYEGTEIFAISIKAYGLSEELSMSVSGSPYLLQVSSLASLGKRHLDKIIENVCRIERYKGPDSSGVEDSGNAGGSGGNNLGTGGGTSGGMIGNEGTGGGNAGSGGTSGGGAGGVGTVGGETNGGSSGDEVGSSGTSTGGEGTTGGNSGNGGSSGGTAGNGGTSGGTADNGGTSSGAAGNGGTNGGAAGNGGTSGGTAGNGGTSSGAAGNGGTNGGTAGNGGTSGGTAGNGGTSGGTAAGNGGTSGGTAGNGGTSGGATGNGGTSGGTAGNGGTNGGATGNGGTSGGTAGNGGTSGGATGNGGTSGGTTGNGGTSGGATGNAGNSGGAPGNGDTAGGGSGGAGTSGGATGNGGTGGGGSGGGGNGGTGGGGSGGGGNGGTGGGNAGGAGDGGIGGGTGSGGGANGGGLGGNAGGSGTGDGGTGPGNNNNNNNGLPFPNRQTLCVPVGGISNPFLRQLYLAGRRPCPIVTIRPLPASNCVDLSNVRNVFVRQALLMANFPMEACPEVAATNTPASITSTASALITTTTTSPPPSTSAVTMSSPSNQQCIDLTNVPSDLHEMVLILNAPLEACANTTATSTSTTTLITDTPSPTTTASATTTNVPCLDLSKVFFAFRNIVRARDPNRPLCPPPTVSPPSTLSTATPLNTTACVDVSIFPPEERPGAIIFLLIYGIIACPLTNETGGNTSLSCMDLSGFSDTDRAIIIEIIKPLPPCNETRTTSAPSTPETPSCFDINSVDDSQRELAARFLEFRSLSPCPPSSNVTTTEARVNTTSVVPTTTPASTACVDVSIFPPQEQPGAIIFLSIYGIQACPLANSSSGGDNSSSCVDISGFSEDQKAIITEIIKPYVPCNETLDSSGATSSPATGGTEVTQLPCLNISSVVDSKQKMVASFMLSHALTPCDVLSNVTSSDNFTTAVPTTQECIDVSGYPSPEERRKAIEFFELYNFTICPEITQTYTATTTANSAVTDTTTVPTTTVCVDISGYTDPEERAKAIEFFELYNIQICPEVQTTSAVETATKMTTTNNPATASPFCVDVGIFPEAEQPGAIVFLSIYGIQACPLSNSTTDTASNSSTNCVDISGFSEEQRAVIIEIIKPNLPCIVSTDISISTPSPTSSGVGAVQILCVNITSVDEEKKQMVTVFMLSHNLTACDASPNVISSTIPATEVPTTKACVVISGYTDPEEREKAIEFFRLYNIRICPEVTILPTVQTTTAVASTDNSATGATACVDVSIFPEVEQPGAIIFLSIYGIQACPLGNSTTDTAGNNSKNCVDISGFSEEQRAVIIEIIKPNVPCNVSTDISISTPSPASSGVGGTQIPCTNISSVEERGKRLVTFFMLSHGLTPCDLSSNITRATAVPTDKACIDVSGYSNPEERAKAIEYFMIYNITICPEITSSTVLTSKALSTVAPKATATPCVDVSVFPIEEQPGAVVFLSIYGILACPLTNSSSASNNSESTRCVDVSGFQESQRDIVIEIFKPLPPCNETSGTITTSARPVVNTNALGITQIPCVDTSFVNNSDKDMAMDFMLSHGLVPCNISLNVTFGLPNVNPYTPTTPYKDAETTATPVTSSCIDVSGYTDPEERRKALEFFRLYNVDVCPETSISSGIQTTSTPIDANFPVGVTPPCVDVSIFPVEERQGAVAFLSIYGILPCPFNDHSSSSQNVTLNSCIDTSQFSDEQKAIIAEVLKPIPLCNESSVDILDTASSVIVSQVTGKIVCFQMSEMDELKMQMISNFMQLHNLSACVGNTSILPEVSTERPIQSEPTEAGTEIPCVSVSGYTDPVEKAKAIDFFNLYNIPICPETSVAPTIQTTPTSSSSQFSSSATVNQLLNYSTAPTTGCVDVSIFPPKEQAGAVLFLSIYGIQACPLSDSTTQSTDSSNCIDVSRFSEGDRAVILEIMNPIPACSNMAQSSGANDSRVEPMATSDTITAKSGCVNITSASNLDIDTLAQFLQLRGFHACSLTSTTLSSTVLTTSLKPPENSDSKPSPSSCIDVSGYTDPVEKANAVAFFQLYNFIICPEVTTTAATPIQTMRPETTNLPSEVRSALTVTTPDPQKVMTTPAESDANACVDVSIFPEKERSNAVVFLSIYGILACNRTSSTSTNENCVELTGFTEAQKTVIIELIKPKQPCIEASLNSSATESVLGVTSTVINNGESTSSVIPCVDLSVYEEGERAAAVEYFRLYGLSPCPNASAIPPTIPTPTAQATVSTMPAATTRRDCVDLSDVVPALRQFVLALNAPLEACSDETDSEVTTSSSDTNENEAFNTSSMSDNDAISPTSSGSNIESSGASRTRSSVLCSGCQEDGGLCYKPDPDSCSNFLQCTSPSSDFNDTTWIHSSIPCPIRTFWSQDALTCVHPEDSSCIKDLCILGQESDILLIANCAQYLHCDQSGSISRRCCPLGQIFLNGVCQEGINSGCEEQCIASSA
ncbi:hypothetical protein PoB_004290200 [Plakobranchus ocellatus]|uniref:Chitin-binding type-2 domain-containing protein n=1 Tax=Plakobranchus ocellatus TaxID=259542 RepID=A0AAV4BB93_9GAST|nr:hypothetical protein PoB_004290200 [Plakobranchus ocellatus]